MDLGKLEASLKDEPKYRTEQVKEAVFKNLLTSWDEAKYLPVPLKQKLKLKFPLAIKAQLYKSTDGQSQKAVITFKDEQKIETVLMANRTGRNSVCVSSQVGCPMGCEFCQTGKMGLIRNLTAGEIITQLLYFARLLGTNKRIDNVVFMGMGEPLLNWENVVQSIKIINDPKAFNIASRKISLSTCGIIPGIKKLTDFPLQINLAISLHAPTSKLRSQLMPVNKKYPLPELMETVKHYVYKTGRKVMFEYLMLKDINDSPQHARQLAKLLDHPLYFVNLIKYNYTQSQFQASTEKKIKEFMQTLKNYNINTARRYSFGEDIAAACGQLAT